MGLSSKQVSCDLQAWNYSLLQATANNDGGVGGGASSNATLELPKPPMKRHQPNQHQPEQLKCPRCDSTNTKFCYYNNYNKSQPRHFCKACKRHWTRGGTLRNVPVGGGRKNKRLRTATTTATTTTSASTSTTKGLGFSTKLSHSRMGIRTHDQKLSLPLALGDGTSIAQTLNQTTLKPQSLLQDRIFDSSIDFAVGKSSASSDSGSLFVGNSALYLPQVNPDLGFPYPSLGSLEENFSCSILNSSAHTPSSVYGYTSEQSTSLEETVIAGLDGTISYNSMHDQPWKSVDATSNLGWEDIDKFVSSDITIPWDEPEI